MSTVSSGDHRAALEQMEQARAVFAPFPSGPSGRLSAPKVHVALAYAIVGDTLLAWTVVGDSVRMVRQTTDRRQLAGIVERVRSAMELGQDGEPVRRDLAQLYDLLIRPLEPHAGRDRPLVIVADGPLASLPFAALYDRQRRRYLVEDRPVEMAATLAGGERPRRRGAPARAFLVADPAFDRGEHVGYDPLPSAAEEVAQIASLYASPQRLDGSRADSAGVSAGFAAADLVHFAAHAVLDEERPEHSFLLLTGRGGSGRLTAEEIARMDLRGVRLVVLSACETARGTGERSGGLAGLSAAFMGAGAEGVLGSL